jgi:hypothetical protein
MGLEPSWFPFIGSEQRNTRDERVTVACRSASSHRRLSEFVPGDENEPLGVPAPLAVPSTEDDHDARHCL